MKRYLENIKTNHFSMLRGKRLFFGLSDSEIYTFLQHSKPYYLPLGSGQKAGLEEKYSHMIAVVISGDVVIFSIDSEGNKTLIKNITDGESSGTLYSFLDYSNALIELEGREESEVILIEPESLFTANESIAVIQQKMLVNLIAAQKDLFQSLSEHLYCLAQRSIRDKIIRYLKFYRDRSQSDEFDIPLTREELASYLAVDRASLSRSLSELKRGGAIDFGKNRFKILNSDIFNV